MRRAYLAAPMPSLISNTRASAAASCSGESTINSSVLGSCGLEPGIESLGSSMFHDHAAFSLSAESNKTMMSAFRIISERPSVVRLSKGKPGKSFPLSWTN